MTEIHPAVPGDLGKIVKRCHPALRFYKQRILGLAASQSVWPERLLRLSAYRVQDGIHAATHLNGRRRSRDLGDKAQDGLTGEGQQRTKQDGGLPQRPPRAVAQPPIAATRERERRPRRGGNTICWASRESSSI